MTGNYMWCENVHRSAPYKHKRSTVEVTEWSDQTGVVMDVDEEMIKCTLPYTDLHDVRP